MESDVFINMHDAAVKEVVAVLKKNEGLSEDDIRLAQYSLDVHCVIMLDMLDKMKKEESR